MNTKKINSSPNNFVKLETKPSNSSHFNVPNLMTSHSLSGARSTQNRIGIDSRTKNIMTNGSSQDSRGD